MRFTECEKVRVAALSSRLAAALRRSQLPRPIPPPPPCHHTPLSVRQSARARSALIEARQRNETARLCSSTRQVSDPVRRAITKALAKVKGEGSATMRSARSKSGDKSRVGGASVARMSRSSDDIGNSSSNANDNGGGSGKDNRSNGSDHERGNGNRANSSIGQTGWEQVKPARSDPSVSSPALASLSYGSLFSQSGTQSEEDLLSAAEASIAAAAWTPTATASKSRLTGYSGSSSRNGSDRKRNGNVADRETASSAAAQSNGASVTPTAAAAATTAPDPPRSSRGARTGHAGGAGSRAPERTRASEGAATVASLQRKLLSSSAPATDPELDDLRRQIKDLALTIAVAEKKDIEGRLALRQALAESEKRAESVGAAAQARSKKLDVLVQVRCLGGLCWRWCWCWCCCWCRCWCCW